MKFNFIKINGHKLGKKVNFRNFTRASIISAAILGTQALHAMEAEHEKAPLSSLPQTAKINHELKKDLRDSIDEIQGQLSLYCIVGTALKALPSGSGGVSTQIGYRNLNVLESYDSLQKSGSLTVDCDIIWGFKSTVGATENTLKRTFIFKASQAYGGGNRGDAWTALKAEVLKNLLDTLKQ